MTIDYKAKRMNDTYFSSSNMCVLWWRDNGLMGYGLTWHVFGCTLGVTYASNVPYCPSIDLTYIIPMTPIREALLLMLYSTKSIITLSSSLVVFAWHR